MAMNARPEPVEPVKAIESKACHFCRCKQTVSDSIPAPQEGRKHFVYCRFCGAAGPLAKTPESAVLRWNKEEEITVDLGKRQF